jgi:hypothetical protein
MQFLLRKLMYLCAGLHMSTSRVHICLGEHRPCFQRVCCVLAATLDILTEPGWVDSWESTCQEHPMLWPWPAEVRPTPRRGCYATLLTVPEHSGASYEPLVSCPKSILQPLLSFPRCIFPLQSKVIQWNCSQVRNGSIHAQEPRDVSLVANFCNPS